MVVIRASKHCITLTIQLVNCLEPRPSGQEPARQALCTNLAHKSETLVAKITWLY